MSVTDQYVGIPFVDGGRTMSGTDCWGLIKILYKDLFDVELPEYYISALDTENVVEAMESEAKGGDWVKVEKAEFGDIIAMSLHPRFRNHVSHVGFYIGRGRFLHTMSKTGSIIQRNNEIGSPEMLGIYRWVANIE